MPLAPKSGDGKCEQGKWSRDSRFLQLMGKVLVRKIGLTTHAALRYEGCEHLQLVAIEYVVYTVM
jgi:hypothetical protein